MSDTPEQAAHDELRTALLGAVAENRVRAFVHHWVELLERPAAGPEPLRELLAEDLEMTFGDGRVLRTYDEVAAWYTGTGAQVEISLHHLRELSVTPLPGRSYEVGILFDWEGIARDGRPMTATTRHEWTLTDTDERHLRLSRFKVTALAPFTPVTAAEALSHFRAASS